MTTSPTTWGAGWTSPEQLTITAGISRLYAVRIESTGQIVGEFNTFSNAARALTSAREALALLADCLAAAPRQHPSTRAA